MKIIKGSELVDKESEELIDKAGGDNIKRFMFDVWE